MALGALSLFNYGLEVTTLNANIDFKADSVGPTLSAVLNLGFYSTQGLADEVVRALQAADFNNSYFVTVNRNVLGGTQNRVAIQTTGTFLSLLFASGPNTNTNAAALLGFNPTDYTGATTYTGNQSTGTPLLPSLVGYNYLDDINQGKVFGAVNVAASGLKESVVFNVQKFIDVQFKYEPTSKLLQWQAFFNWAIQQRPFDFIPEITNPSKAFQLTLEKTSYDGKGLGFRMTEMLPNFPNLYDTGMLNFRIIESNQSFL